MEKHSRFTDKDVKITELPPRETMFRFGFKFRGLKLFFGF
jgi:hypothetical protein